MVCMPMRSLHLVIQCGGIGDTILTAGDGTLVGAGIVRIILGAAGVAATGVAGTAAAGGITITTIMIMDMAGVAVEIII